jgi:hypothetical protein
MRIRHLKRKVGAVIDSVWPPQWTFSMHPRGGDEILVGDEGVRESVKRMGERLSLTMKYKVASASGVLVGCAAITRHRREGASGESREVDQDHWCPNAYQSASFLQIDPC